MKLELFLTERLFTLENKKLLSHFRIHRESATSAQMDGWIMTSGLLNTG